MPKIDNLYRVIVTGSRDWVDHWTIYNALKVLPNNTIIVHGAARGADTIANQIAENLLLLREPHPANWERYGKAAGHIRNLKMLSLGAQLVLAFPLPHSKGTYDMIQIAQNSGIKVITHHA